MGMYCDDNMQVFHGTLRIIQKKCIEMIVNEYSYKKFKNILIYKDISVFLICIIHIDYFY